MLEQLKQKSVATRGKDVPRKSFQVKELQPTKQTLAKDHQAVTDKQVGVLISCCCWEEEEKELRGERAGRQVIPRYPITQPSHTWANSGAVKEVRGKVKDKRAQAELWLIVIQTGALTAGVESIVGDGGVTCICTRQISSANISVFSSLYILA